MEKTKTDTGPLRERNRQRTNERIVKAAAELFHTRGYDHSTMDEIAALAEVSRATLFNYFPTKDSLLVPFIEEIFEERVLPSLTAYLDGEPETFAALRHLFMCIYRDVLVVPDIDQALKRELLRPKAFPDAGQTQNSGFMKMLAAVLHYGQRRGDIRMDMNADKLAAYCGALYGMILLNSVLKAEVREYPIEIDNLLRFIVSGLQPDQG